MEKRTMRGQLAVLSGMAARRASRLLGRGSGGMIGGKVALAAHPEILHELGLGRSIALVTGTNGKSTTTKMLRAALGGDSVASNTHGDNMTAGIVSALMSAPRSPFAAIEVDEMHLPAIAREVRPSVIVLLNLSRDQLDRVGEIGAVEKRLRQAVDENPQAVIVANCDDPLIASAAWDAPNVVWVAAGSGWGADSMSFPRGGGRVLRDGGEWSVEGSDTYRRPAPDWCVDSEVLRGPDGEWPLKLALPGVVNQANAAQAVAAAVALDVDPKQAVERVEGVADVAGRYQRFDVDGRHIRLLLAKNPAGWQEALSMVEANAQPVVIGVNGQVPDGEDLSWLWDVNFEGWAHRGATATGERGADLAVRLDYAGLGDAFEADPLSAILAQEPGDVEVLVNYTCFRDLLSTLRARGYQELTHD